MNGSAKECAIKRVYRLRGTTRLFGTRASRISLSFTSLLATAKAPTRPKGVGVSPGTNRNLPLSSSVRNSFIMFLGSP